LFEVEFGGVLHTPRVSLAREKEGCGRASFFKEVAPTPVSVTWEKLS
jgi:hypothetical protein